jgi:hypothetical protein
MTDVSVICCSAQCRDLAECTPIQRKTFLEKFENLVLESTSMNGDPVDLN